MSDENQYINKEMKYLTDEELALFIESIENGTLLHPPRDFQSNVLQKVRQKKKHRKDMQLFSYSMKVVMATAAALIILLTVPQNIYSQDTLQKYQVQSGKSSYNMDFFDKLNQRVNGCFSILNDKLNQLVTMEVNYNEKEEK